MFERLTLLSLVLCGSLASRALAHPGHGIVVDSKGSVHFVDLANESIWTITPEGRLLQTPVDKHLHRLVIDADDTLSFEHVEFVGPPVTVGDPPRVEEAGTRMSSLWSLDAAGALTPILAPTPAAYHTAKRPVLDDFGNGITLLRDADGASYGVVYRDDDPFPMLVKRTPGTLGGATSVVIPRLYEIRGGEEHPVDFGFFQAFTWGANGSILTSERGTVRRITPDGVITPVGGAPLRRDPSVGPTPVWQDSVLGVAENAKGEVFAADYGQSCVRKIDAADQVTTVHRASFGWSPTGVAVAGDDLYILENRVDIISPVLSVMGVRGGLGGPRVLKLSPDGTVTVLATVNGHRAGYFLTTVGVVALMTIILVWRRVQRPAPTRAIDLLEP